MPDMYALSKHYIMLYAMLTGFKNQCMDSSIIKKLINCRSNERPQPPLLSFYRINKVGQRNSVIRGCQLIAIITVGQTSC